MKMLFNEPSPISDQDAVAIFQQAFGNNCTIDDIQRSGPGCAKYTYVISANNPDERYILQVNKQPLESLTSLETEEANGNKKKGKKH
ncbi:hypothetical protein ACFLS1_02560 [Verrucomicrobiota bacterium]